MVGIRGMGFIGAACLLVACVRSPEDGFSFEPGGAGPQDGSDGDSEGAAADDAVADTGGESSGDVPFDPSAPDDDAGSDGPDPAADDDTTTGQTVAIGGGCSAGATTVLSSQIITAIYTGALRSPGGTGSEPHGSIYVMSSGDLCELTITIEPDTANDSITAVLRDPDDIAVEGASCAANAGQPCTIELPDGPGEPMPLRIELRDDVDNQIGSLRISVSGKTEGLAAPVAVDAAFRNLDYADFVIWPVGPATGTYAYQWSTSTATSYNVGVLSASGAMTPSLNTLTPNTSAWPAAGTPNGWYVFAASTTNPSAKGDPWSFAVVP